MASPRPTHLRGRPGHALHRAARRVGRAHGRVLSVGVASAPAQDNWAATGDAVREAWVAAGADIRRAMGQVAAEHEEIPA